MAGHLLLPLLLVFILIIYLSSPLPQGVIARPPAAAVSLPYLPPLPSATSATASVPSPAHPHGARRVDPSVGRAWRPPAAPVDPSLLPSRGRGGLLPGRPSLAAAGAAAPALDLLVVSLTRPLLRNAARRVGVREALAALLDATTYRVAFYWLMTEPTDTRVLVEVLAENATHGDIVFAPQSTADADLSRKVWDEMRHAARCGFGGSPFFLKLDDDAAVLWDRFLPTLYAEMPRSGLVWCSQGSAAGVYCVGPYLMSADVVKALAAEENRELMEVLGDPTMEDKAITGWAWNKGYITAFGSDRRWHNNDMGSERICLCKPWTLTSDSLVVHKVEYHQLHAWLTNKTFFALLGQPHNRYGYNVCAPDNRDDPTCNWVEGCRGAPPAPLDCIIRPEDAPGWNIHAGKGRHYES